MLTKKQIEDKYNNIIQLDRQGIHWRDMHEHGTVCSDINELAEALNWYERKIKQKYRLDYVSMNPLGTYIPAGVIMFPEDKPIYFPHSFATMYQSREGELKWKDRLISRADDEEIKSLSFLLDTINRINYSRTSGYKKKNELTFNSSRFYFKFFLDNEKNISLYDAMYLKDSLIAIMHCKETNRVVIMIGPETEPITNWEIRFSGVILNQNSFETKLSELKWS